MDKYKLDKLKSYLPYGIKKKIAKKLGVSPSKISRVLNGQECSADILNELIDVAEETIKSRERLNKF